MDPVVTRELHLEKLRAFHESMVAAMAECGCGGVRLGEVMAQNVHAECMQCGISLTGGEISSALTAESAHAAANPRHARLLQRYCARSGCPSYFYRFTFSPAPELDWEKCLARASEIEAGVNLSVVARHASSQAAVRRLRLRRFYKGAGIVGTLIGLWFLRHWWTTGTLPGVAPAPKYQIDLRTVPPERPLPARP